MTNREKFIQLMGFEPTESIDCPWEMTCGVYGECMYQDNDTISCEECWDMRYTGDDERIELPDKI